MSTKSTRAALLATTAAIAPVVTGGGVIEKVTLGPRVYTLAAPTLAEVGQHLDDQARNGAPGAVEMMEAVRAALQEDGEGDSALTAFEEAEDAWVSFSSIHIVTGPDATENIQAQATALHLALLKARRGRDRAVAKVARHAQVLDIRAQQERAQWEEHCRIVALLCRSWEGAGLPEFPKDLDREAVAATLPMGDVAALARRAYQLMQPTGDAEKNSAPPSS
ncbi:hypothetical protein VQH23_16265 [Pararoseomonas sp. SCSIO 73927]|uniref:hypothetical protein n=1 Tax=Pararoseomonas sp. SCSIO 73927 TaxID=3114537 RepID=UPI0030CEA5CC